MLTTPIPHLLPSTYDRRNNTTRFHLFAPYIYLLQWICSRVQVLRALRLNLDDADAAKRDATTRT